eukprot:s1600_g9.t1
MNRSNVAVCNLASISLPAFVADGGSSYDFQQLYEVTKVVTRNLNKARKSNFRHRPVGLGVQGLADAFLMMKLPFESEEARRLNEDCLAEASKFQCACFDIFETIYFAACEASCELAELSGPYETYPGSPASEGEPRDFAGAQSSLRPLRHVEYHGVRDSALQARVFVHDSRFCQPCWTSILEDDRSEMDEQAASAQPIVTDSTLLQRQCDGTKPPWHTTADRAVPDCLGMLAHSIHQAAGTPALRTHSFTRCRADHAEVFLRRRQREIVHESPGRLIEGLPECITDDVFATTQVLWESEAKNYSVLGLGFASLHNHAEDPNTEFSWEQRREHGRRLVGRFYTLRPVNKDEELFISYGPKWFESRNISAIPVPKAT